MLYLRASMNDNNIPKLLGMILLVIGLGTNGFAQQISGTVSDPDGDRLEAATVILLPAGKIQFSDKQGSFRFEGLKQGSYQLIAKMLGYESDSLAVELGDNNLVLNFKLSPLPYQLAEVEIHDEHAKQEDFLATSHLDAHELSEDIRGTLVKSLAKLPGLDAINTGVGIAKPVIRGLSFNRVIVNDRGIKQEGQQWGADHGLEVDAFAVSRIEVVKGPASLQYGSDGLGGVINLMPGPIPERDSWQAGLDLIGKSNNAHLGASLGFAVNKNDKWLKARFTHQQFGDYRVPADTFVYQGFVLPIFEGYLKNTAGRENNLELQTGMRRASGVTRLTFSQYELRSGLFSGAVGTPRSYALQPDGNRRDQDLPFQRVKHQKLIFNHLEMFGKDHLSVDLGYQRNLRQERGFPEFHNQPEIDLNNTLAIQLELQTFSANFHYQHHLTSSWHMTYGASAQYQQNRASGWEFLLPNFETTRAGAYVISHWQPEASRWKWSAGLRGDYATNDNDAFQRFIWNSNGRIIDSLGVPMVNRTFFNWSGSLGGIYQLREEQAWLKVNLGKSFRVPYPSETVSNGVHHGTFRHEQGNPDLRSEQGYQLDVGLDLSYERLSLQFATYFNFFDNFIYLGPSGRLSTLPEAGQIFLYQQNDAIYTGFEVDWQWQASERLRFSQTAEYVWNRNLNTSLGLPFTPQPSLLNELAYRWRPKAKGWGESYAKLSWELVAGNGPGRVDRNEQTTPGYQLLDAALGTRIKLGKNWLELSLQGQNLLNVAYFNHLSRYRLINVPEQGRNFVLSLRIPLEGNIKK
jgi:iron complex outermembrane receptor protein